MSKITKYGMKRRGTIKKLVIKILNNIMLLINGHEPFFHRIPFGPLKNKYIFMSFEQCPITYFGLHDLEVISLINKLTSKDSTVYDVGAHLGYMAIEMSRLARKVLCFELVPSTAKNLIRTIDKNNIHNAAVYPFGLGAKIEEIDIYVDNRNMGNISSKVQVDKKSELCKIMSLDEFLTRYEVPIPEIIKVDIETAEIDFIIGATNTLKKHKPILLIEFHGKKLLEDGFELLNEIGYSFYLKDGSKLNNQRIKNYLTFHQTVLCSA